MRSLRRRGPLVALLCALLVVAGCSGSASLQAADSRPLHAPLPTARAAPLGTPPPAQPSHRHHFLQSRLAGMTLRDKVRQLIVVGFSGTSAPRRLIRTLHPGGLIYFSDNLRGLGQISTMSRTAQRTSRRVGQPLLLMTDQEGGPVTRIPGTAGVPGGAEFNGSARKARRTAARTGNLLHRLHINVDLAPVADVNTVGSAGVIGARSFSSNPLAAARLVRAQICGYHAGGVAATAKHWPGHGSTTTDSHISTATITKSAHTWRSVDRVPFESAVRSHADLVLVGHLALPALDSSGRPATISGTLVRRLLRQRLGFDGVVITDALNMGGITSWGSSRQIAVRAVGAGIDLLLMPPRPAEAIRGLVDAVHKGRLAQPRINASVKRILLLKHRLGLYRASAALPNC